jgi:hypothetical protein
MVAVRTVNRTCFDLANILITGIIRFIFLLELNRVSLELPGSETVSLLISGIAKGYARISLSNRAFLLTCIDF